MIYSSPWPNRLRLTGASEVVYPLSVSCQIEWLDNTNHGYDHASSSSVKIPTDCPSRWEDRESSPSVHAAKLKTSASSKPLSNLRPSSTNTFCVPDDSDVEELQDPNINLLDEAVEGFHAAALRASQGATDPPAEDDSVNQENNPPQDKLQTSQVQHSDCIILERPDQQMDDQSDEDSDDYLDSDEDDSDLESSAPPSSGPSPFSISSNGIKGKSHKEESSVEPSDDESDPESEIESDEEPAASPREQSVNNDQVEFINPDVLMQNYPCDDTTFDQTRKIVPENSVNSTAPVTTGALKVNPEKPESVRVEVCGGVHRLHPHSVILPEEPLERLPTLESNQHTAYQDGPFACINIPDIEETAAEKQTEKPAWSLKRKISEIQDAQIVDSALPATQADLDSLPKPEVVDAITSALSESEPPKKRVKTSRSTSGTVASYTATAVISALLGGLGTIALLAALPAEYFQ